jgi:hypothetical protein
VQVFGLIIRKRTARVANLVMTIRLRRSSRLFSSLLIACTIATAAYYATVHLPESGLLGLAALGIAFLGIPGVAVSVILARDIHDASLSVGYVANVILYTALTYRLLTRNSDRHMDEDLRDTTGHEE